MLNMLFTVESSNMAGMDNATLLLPNEHLPCLHLSDPADSQTLIFYVYQMMGRVSQEYGASERTKVDILHQVNGNKTW
jgi:hypothetical protein